MIGLLTAAHQLGHIAWNWPEAAVVIAGIFGAAWVFGKIFGD